MKIQAIVFDLDGTLIDQEGAEREALEALFSADIDLAPNPGYHAFLRAWRNAADQFLQLYLDKKIGFDEQRMQRFMAVYQEFGQDCPREKALGLQTRYMQLYAERWRAYEDAVPTLTTLKAKARLAVITNGDSVQQRAKVSAAGLTQFFEHILVSSEAGVAKPLPGIFEQSAKALKLEPGALAYVGDRLDVDAAGALAAHWTPVWLDRKGMPGAALEPGIKVANSLLELEGLLGL